MRRAGRAILPVQTQRLEPRVLLSALPIGGEFRVNTYTTGNQQSTTQSQQAVAMDAAGNSVVVWSSYGQDQPGIAGWGVFAQRYDAAGLAVGGEFQVNTFTTGSQSDATVAMDAAGNFVVTWTSEGQDGSNSGIYAQRYSAAGVAQGAEFRVNTYTTGIQQTSSVAMDADGDFVVTWSSDGQDGHLLGIFGQRYNAAGATQGGEFQVNSYTTAAQNFSSVAMDDAGNFVVTWTSYGQDDGSSDGIYAQRFNAAGATQGAEFRVNTVTTGPQRFSTVAMDADGDFVVTWSAANQDGSNFAVIGQRYNAAGVAQGGEFQVNSYTTHIQNHSSVAMDADGNFVVAWASYEQDGDENGVYAREFSSAGVAQGTDFRVNSYTTNAQQWASVAKAADGNFVVVWSSFGQTNNDDVYAQRFDAFPPTITEVLALGNTLTEDERLIGSPTSLTVAFSEDMFEGGGPTGPDSVTNPANWALARNGLDVTAQIQSINYGFNVDTGRFEAVLTFAGPLAEGVYSLTAKGSSTLIDPAGHPLDGNGDGTGGDDFLRHFEIAPQQASGGEFRVNTYTTGSQRTHVESPKSVAMDSQGNFVVTWESNGQDGHSGGVFAQRYDAAGVAQGLEFQVNTYTTDIQRYSTVAMDASGNFVVTWTGSGGQDGMFDGVYAQRFNAAGIAQGSEFQVNTYTTQSQFWSNVAMDSDGDFIITWTSHLQEGGGPAAQDGVYARRYNAAGVAQGGEFLVNTTTTNYQRWSTVAVDADGDFVVTWSSYAQDGSDYGIYAQRYNASGVAQGTEFQVNSYTTGEQSHSTVALDAAGNFVITWTSVGQDGSVAGVYAQRYNAEGIAQGGEFRLNSYTTADQFYSSIAMDADGDFVATWTSAGQDGGNNGIYARAYDALGVAQASEFRVNTYTTLAQSYSTVAMDADGDFVVTWSDVAQDGSNYGVYAQRYFGRRPGISNQMFSIAENRPVGQNVGTVVASDPDVGQSLTYAIVGGNTGNVFAINPMTGQITVASATLNFEGTNQYDLLVQVTDNGSPNTLSDAATVTINITDLNEAPTFLAPTTFSIAENRSVGFMVGDVNAVDPEGNTLTYSIVGGDPNAQFAINSSTGVITVAKATIDFETTPQFVLQVRAQDNGSPSNFRTQNITVNITNLNEAPVFLAPTTFSIAENRSVGFTVGDVNAVDPEGNTLAYSIVGGDPNAQFAINSASGVITVAKATIDFESTPQFILQVRATDNGTPSNFRTQNITVNITNLNEPPVFLAPTTFSIAENRSVGFVVGDVNTVDPEGNAITYSIVGGDPNTQFAINSGTGVITVAKATIDFETTPQFVLQVKAQDNGSPANSRTQNITVNVTNLNEAPVFLAPTTFGLAENSPNGTLVGMVKTVDPEANTVAYSITAGNTGNAFAINAGTGQITVANSAALDFETTPQFLLSVKAQDNGSPSNSRTQTITINLTNVVGGRVPAKKAATGSDIVASAGATGQQIVSPTAAVTPPPKRTEPKADPELYSFTLYEPPAAAPLADEEA